jgi:hypothetical protein
MNEEFSKKIRDIKDGLTDSQIIKLLKFLGASNYINGEKFIIFPTICHNISEERSSMKLYYYKKNKMFHCYTKCGETFSIYDLFKKYYELHGINYSFYKDIYQVITEQCNINITSSFDDFKYSSVRERYSQNKEDIDLKILPANILNIFDRGDIYQWKKEGISENSLVKYDIRFSINQNKIIIPHFDKDGNLVGIRGRALNQYDIDTFGKYMPIKIEGIWYSHPLSLNLYGLNISKDNIQESGVAIIFEGEKSCLLYDTYFNDNNISVACCGSSFNKRQLDLLLKYCNVKEVVIAFDKEFKKNNDELDREYFNKLYNLCLKYNKYCKMSFIYDRFNLLDYKDSPIDKGADIFKKLLNERIEVYNR